MVYGVGMGACCLPSQDILRSARTAAGPDPSRGVSGRGQTFSNAFAHKYLHNYGIPAEDLKKHSWKISRFDDTLTLSLFGVESDTFTAGGHEWNILCRPQNCVQEEKVNVSIYLNCKGPKQLAKNWHVCAQFIFAISNPNDGTCYLQHGGKARFSDSNQSWGFSNFAELDKLLGPDGSRVKPIIENHEAVVTAFVQVFKDETGFLWHDFVNYDSKKETGYVSLKNHGGAGYLNPLLQLLFSNTYLRKAVYQIPTEHDGPDSVALTLQRIFYELQTSDKAVGIAQLTKSLIAWKPLDVSQSQVVHEFMRMLQRELQSRTKNTSLDGFFRYLFVGKCKRYIKCINVDHESSQEENFSDVQLDIKDFQGRPFKTLQESLKAYVAPQKIDGDIKHYAGDDHGLQVANEGTVFIEFPPVLHLHLNRFEYNFQEDKQIKIDDGLEFPSKLDLAPYLDESADKTANWNYRLQGVLVHSGEAQEMKYFAFIQPHPQSKWYKFDDDRVIPVTAGEVLKSSTNVHMLVYIRESKEAAIRTTITQADTPTHLKSLLQQAQKLHEQKKKEDEERHLYLTTKIVTEETFRVFQGFDLALFDDKTMPPSDVPTFRVAKKQRFLDFKSTLARDLGYQPEQIRLRPLLVPVDRPRAAVPENVQTLTMEVIRDTAMASSTQDLKLYLEVLDPEHEAEAAESEERQVMIMVKYFNVSDQALSGIGHFWVKEGQRVADLVSLINARMKFPKGSRLKMYEERRPGRIVLMDPNTTFGEAQMLDGDIICFEIEFSDEELEKLGRQYAYLDPVSFYDFLANRVLVRFKPRHTNMAKMIEFDIPLSKTLTYSQMAHLVGKRLHRNPARLRFINSEQGDPHHVIRRQGTVADMIKSSDNDSINNTLFYELLDLPVDGIETERKVKITWTGAHNREDGTYSFLMPKTASMQDVIDKLMQLSTFITFSKNSTRKIKLFTFHDGQMEKQFSGEELLINVADLENLHATELQTMTTQYDPVAMLKMLHFVKKLSVDGTNYPTWLKTVESILGMATGKVNLLTSPDQTIGCAEDLIIKQAIAASVDDALVLTVVEAESGMEAFDKIQKRWNSRNKQVIIMKEILQTRFKICDTTADIGSHFQVIKNLAGRLFKSGFELTKESFIGLLFHLSLPRLDIPPFGNISRRIDARPGGAATISNDQLVQLAQTELQKFRKNRKTTSGTSNSNPTEPSSSTGKSINRGPQMSKPCHNCSH
ncbi:Ubiquitin carboxyl-terminal hydrolase 7 [Puccinia graminis f. sp. tritici]|uniref:ubiquitinyl hydrolase 1 n=1 Tax=Puccinia graminis f. sp. tritici TaxID=56615 RepID=A0A5B0PW47_PUCGR|nr:Ubiquitin carboxyl-terminal hydrolase 7 [Puccinia graminis f. sp. tritici]